MPTHARTVIMFCLYIYQVMHATCITQGFHQQPFRTQWYNSQIFTNNSHYQPPLVVNTTVKNRTMHEAEQPIILTWEEAYLMWSSVWGLSSQTSPLTLHPPCPWFWGAARSYSFIATSHRWPAPLLERRRCAWGGWTGVRGSRSLSMDALY